MLMKMLMKMLIKKALDAVSALRYNKRAGANAPRIEKQTCSYENGKKPLLIGVAFSFDQYSGAWSGAADSYDGGIGHSSCPSQISPMGAPGSASYSSSTAL